MGNNILTAEEFYQKAIDDRTIGNDITDLMNAYAKMHVAVALKAASENALVSLAKDWIRKEETIHPNELIAPITIKVNKDSIINSYPLTNIK